MRMGDVGFRGWTGISALLCATALVLLYTAAVRTSSGQVVDLVVYRWSHFLNHGGEISGAIRSYLHLPIGLVYLVLAVIAVRSRRWSSLAASLAIVVATPLASHLLRDVVFDRPYLGDHDFLINTLPSGHVSVSAALVVAIVLLWPSPARWPIVTGAGVVAVACLASVIAHAHRPSDVAASVLLTGAITCATLAGCGPNAAPPALRRVSQRPSAGAGSPPLSGS